MQDANDRRRFLRHLLVASCLGALPGLGAAASPGGGRTFIPRSEARKADPDARGGSQRPPGSKLKLSCNLYSYNHPLRSGTMTLEDVVTECARIGFDAVDPTGYYFPGYPDPPPDEYVYRIKRHAFLLGLDISGTGVRNDFTAVDPAARKADLAHVARWVDVAAKLDAPVLRVFAGAGVPEGRTRPEVFNWVVDALQECAAAGERRGVMIVLQNHDELIKTADEVLSIRERVDSDWFGLNVDIGSLRTGDPYEEVARLAPYADTWQIKETVYDRGVPEKTDVDRIVRILREAGYRGYIPLETLGDGDEPRERLPAFFREVRRAVEAAE